ncbi:zinc-binding dehydrogenase [Catellatospora aurea]|uniref:Zinc-binding dehydrogenase n=1 Tax=Catellatospora aurea TaxID=1337874 RepID=A0ABW2H124_9ACTN
MPSVERAESRPLRAAQPGEWLLQTAAGSTVGRLVIQLSRHLGIRTINVVRRRDAVGEIEALGGDEVICTEDEDLLQRVPEIAGPDGVRKALDCVAGVVGAQVSQALAPGGQLVIPLLASSPARAAPGPPGR